MTPEHPTCPRCESGNTKFCYYNNYNLSQPRYLCKACRRYWTLGGSLRNIPSGGTSRKNVAAAAVTSSSSSSRSSRSSRRRRSRPCSSSAVSSSSPPSPASPVSDAPGADDGANGQALTDMSGTFAAVLEEPLPPGSLALGDPLLNGRTGFELDVCVGLDGMQETGLELLRSASAPAWPFASDDVGETVGGFGDAWNFTGEDGGGDPSDAGGDSGGFMWTDLGIPTRGKSVR